MDTLAKVPNNTHATWYKDKSLRKNFFVSRKLPPFDRTPPPFPSLAYRATPRLSPSYNAVRVLHNAVDPNSESFASSWLPAILY